MRHIFSTDDNNGPSSNPSDDPDVLNFLSTVDEYARGQNGHKVSLEMQLLLLPMWTIRSDLLDLTKPLQDIAARYMNSTRPITMKISSDIISGTASPEEIKFIFQEIFKLNRSYNEHTAKIAVVRQNLNRHLNIYTRNHEVIWERIDYLKVTDEQACKLLSFCIKTMIEEYELLEQIILDALKNCTGIITCTMQYLLAIVANIPDIISEFDALDGTWDDCF